MDPEKKPVDTPAAAAPQTSADDSEAKIASLEAEKAKLIEESANYKLGMMKAKGKAKEDTEEDEDARMERIARKALADSRLADIAREQDAIIKAALKENRELKLAYLNKDTTPPAGIGSHNESTPVRDTLVTPEQAAAFKQRGWTDKDIERYKKNLNKYSGR